MPNPAFWVESETFPVPLLQSLSRYIFLSLFSLSQHYSFVISPAFQLGPYLHGDGGVHATLPGTITPEICCWLGLLPSLPLSRCQRVVH